MPRLALFTTLCAGCHDDPAGVQREPTRVEPPGIESSAVVTNPNNVLALGLSARTRRADSASVRYHPVGQPASEWTTPAVPVVDDSVQVPVLGLHPEMRYALELTLFGPGGTTVGPAHEADTGRLPGDLPSYSAGGPDPSPGYLVFSSGLFGIVIDNDGRVVWYHRFPNRSGLAFLAQRNGRYVTRPGPPGRQGLPFWIEMDTWGEVTRVLGCVGGLDARLHDLLVGADGDYWILCDETRTADLTALGEAPDAEVLGTVVQHVLGDGSLAFQWSSFEHLSVTDLDVGERIEGVFNWTHGNALDLTPDGGLLVSLRNPGEIVKVDPSDGAVVWRLGGPRNEFTFLDTSVPAFSRQHGVRSMEGGVLLLDNLGDPRQSMAERYVLDESARTARLVWQRGAGGGVVTQIGGSVQPLPGGRTLVSYGTSGRVEEYDEAGRLVWRIEGDAGYVFRAQRIRSLYAPDSRSPR